VELSWLTRLTSWIGVRRKVADVFTMAPRPSRYTYVDRSHLDHVIRRTLDGGKHVAIHGESKLGKSWLRAKTLKENQVARVQCLPGMTVSAVITQALGELGVNETVSVSIENASTASMASGAKLNVKVASLSSDGSITQEHRESVETRPVGEDRNSLGWVARWFIEKRRTPVFEDFHNLDPDEQRAMAFVIKALGELEVPCVVVGIWTDTHLLKLHNGELDGRIEDVRVRWSFAEMEAVVSQGCDALNIDMAEPLRHELVRSAYASVGLLQELCAATLASAGVETRPLRRRSVENAALTASGIRHVVDQIGSRFDPFLQRIAEVQPADAHPSFYRYLSGALVGRIGEQELLEGISADDLTAILALDDPSITREQVVASLAVIGEAHRSAGINPLVLAFDQARERLILVDRRLLLFLKERPPH
jgi:hypothetical protein